jgi:tRNA(Ile)-lysidine synthase
LVDRDPGTPKYFINNPSVAEMDYDRIQLPVSIRNIRPGDRMQPLGMTGSKKIKSIFIDEKIPRRERRRVPLLLGGQSVLWIGGWRLGDGVRVTGKTSRILKTEIN